MSLEPNALKMCLRRLQEQLTKLQAIYLFGCQAEGQAGPDSDVDLAVLLLGPLPVSSASRAGLGSRTGRTDHGRVLPQPSYEIRTIGPTRKSFVTLSGRLELVLETLQT